EEFARVRPLVEGSPRANAHLIYVGDKSVFANDEATAFLMYAVSGLSWIVLDDPIGAPRDCGPLVDRFIKLCDKNGGWPVFYRAAPAFLSMYLEYGLAVAKLGEVARVPLQGFSMDGPTRRNLRRVHAKMVKEGCTFEMASPPLADPLIATLKEI